MGKTAQLEIRRVARGADIALDDSDLVELLHSASLRARAGIQLE